MAKSTEERAIDDLVKAKVGLDKAQLKLDAAKEKATAAYEEAQLAAKEFEWRRRHPALPDDFDLDAHLQAEEPSEPDFDEGGELPSGVTEVVNAEPEPEPVVEPEPEPEAVKPAPKKAKAKAPDATILPVDPPAAVEDPFAEEDPFG